MLQSKLPNVGTTIFTIMSTMAAKHNAINLSQGYPDFDCPPKLLERINYYLRHGANQYAPMAGVPALREAIAEKTSSLYRCDVCPDQEITITSGATEALFAAIAATVHAGDEVLIFDPAYDSYAPVVALMGGVAIHIPLLEDDHFSLDFVALEAALNDRTRLIIINTPHNPTGSVLSMAGLDRLAALVGSTNTLILSDEVYEHMVYDGAEHASVLRHADLRERSIDVSSFGKTYHVTGWKVAYMIAPIGLTAEIRKLHQYLTFSTFTPAQFALADFLRDEPEHYLSLPDFYQSKRDVFRCAMQASRFQLAPCTGTYFQLARYDAISDISDTQFCEYLTKEVGVAAIPLSVFSKQATRHQWLRFCFAKNDETLLSAAEKLCQL